MSDSLKKAFILIGISFAVLIAAIVSMLVVANQHYDPIMDEDYYRKGLDYQAILDQEKRAVAQKWQLSIAVGSKPGRDDNAIIERGTHRVTVTLSNQGGHRLQKATIDLSVDRGARKGRNYQLRLMNPECRQAGCLWRYSANIDVDRPGSWHLQALALINAEARLFLSKRLEVL